MKKPIFGGLIVIGALLAAGVVLAVVPADYSGVWLRSGGATQWQVTQDGDSFTVLQVTPSGERTLTFTADGVTRSFDLHRRALPASITSWWDGADVVIETRREGGARTGERVTTVRWSMPDPATLVVTTVHSVGGLESRPREMVFQRVG